MHPSDNKGREYLRDNGRQSQIPMTATGQVTERKTNCSTNIPCFINMCVLSSFLLPYHIRQVVLVRVSIAVIKHHEQE